MVNKFGDAEVLQSIVSLLSRLDEPERLRILRAVSAYFSEEVDTHGSHRNLDERHLPTGKVPPTCCNLRRQVNSLARFKCVPSQKNYGVKSLIS